jgi:hypothetical protein
MWRTINYKTPLILILNMQLIGLQIFYFLQAIEL